MSRLFSLIALLFLAACAGPQPIERVQPANAATAVFAAGCFWCVEEAFEKTPGVSQAISGYTGGTTTNPTYQQVTADNTGHYEAVKVIYDPAVVTYAQLLDVFWKNVDPFDPIGQFCDKGTSYRGAIFPATAEETAAAGASKQAVADRFSRAVAVEVLPVATFYDAETYHQDYYLKNSQTYNFYKWRCGRAQRLEGDLGSRLMLGSSRRGLMVGGAAALVAGPGLAQTGGVARFAVNRAGSGTASHAAFDTLLSRRARASRDGVVRVDYAGWKASAADRAALKAYIASLSRLSPLALTRPEQFAFWANLYNAVTIDVVLEAWPVRSIRDIRSGLVAGPWKRKVATVGGVELSLDDMEHNILRKGWSDPRVHYAVNCASYSCPNLPMRAFRGATLGPALDAAARAYVNSPRGVTFDGDVLVVSSIYKWYAADFGGSDARIIAHLARYADAPLKGRLQAATRIGRDTYDWSLNAVPRG